MNKATQKVIISRSELERMEHEITDLKRVFEENEWWKKIQGLNSQILNLRVKNSELIDLLEDREKKIEVLNRKLYDAGVLL